MTVVSCVNFSNFSG